MNLRWGIVGVGIAGRARARALERTGRRLDAVFRGRFAAQTGARSCPSLGELLRCVDVAIVASPSEHHASQVQQALEAGVHVVCEYPIARTASEAEALFAAARSQNRVLHVEHIERLSPTTLRLAAWAEGVGTFRGAMRFTSPGPPWDTASEHAWHNISRLHRLEAILGPVSHGEVTQASGDLIELDLHWDRGTVHARWERGPSHPRSLHLVLEGAGDRWQVEGRGLTRNGLPVAQPGVSLFEADLDVAERRILVGGDAYVSDESIVRILARSQAIGAAGTM